MNTRNKLLLFLAATLLLSVAVGAHHHYQHFEYENYERPAVALQGENLFWQAVYWVWGYHDRLHWIFIILMLYTCYHFRFFFGRNIITHPGKCSWESDPKYRGEVKLMKWHRLFWYANVFLIAIHTTEVLEGFRTLFVFNQYTYFFTMQNAGIFIETFYVAAVWTWLLSCHFFRYLTAWDANTCCSGNTGGCACACAAEGVDVPWILRMNQKHGVFMWLAVIGSLALLAVEGHL